MIFGAKIENQDGGGDEISLAGRNVVKDKPCCTIPGVNKDCVS